MDAKNYIELDTEEELDLLGKFDIPKDTKSLDIQKVDHENATRYSNLLPTLKLTTLSIFNVSVDKSWICDTIRSCTALQELTINTNLSIQELHSLLIAIDRHKSLVNLNIQMDELISSNSDYLDAWQKFTKFNKSLLYATLCSLSINREDSLLKVVEIRNNQCKLKDNTKLTPVLVNWLQYKYPDSNFWHGALQTSNTESLEDVTENSRLITGLNKQHLEIKRRPLRVASVVIGMLYFFTGCLVMAFKDSVFSLSSEASLTSTLILFPVIAIPAVICIATKCFSRILEKCALDNKNFEYEATLQNGIA